MPSAIPAAAEVEQRIDRVVETIAAKRPMLQSVVKPFADLYREKARLVCSLRAESNAPALEGFGSRLDDGAPLLSILSLGILEPPLNRAFTALMPTLKTGFPAMAGDFDRILAAHGRGGLDLVILADAYLGRTIKPHSDHPDEPPAVGFVIHTVLSAVLQALAPSLGAQIQENAWHHGFCPICGSLPAISYLSKAEPLGSEYLVGGGGQRYLHCVLCGHDWRVQRNLCAVCEKEDTEMKMYFTVPEEPGERIDVCHHCHHYLPCIDLRERDTLPHLDTACVSLAHLDMLVQEKGYAPMVPMPWNTFQ